jgi:hypothetical protein
LNASRLSQNGPQRHGLELLDESVGVSGSGAYQCFALENLAGADANRVLVLAACNDFPNFWKDADPQIPIRKQAKAEYSKLQSRATSCLFAPA